MNSILSSLSIKSDTNDNTFVSELLPPPPGIVGKRDRGAFKETNDWMLGLKEIFGQILLIF
ncbi:hypothetical protein B6U90_07345, partial [Thermoplasmatales archaeon ex4484_6]